MLSVPDIIDALVPVVHAQGPCWGVDCGGVGGNTLPAFIVVIASILVDVVSGMTVLFVVIGGATMLLSFGNESQVEKGRKGVVNALIGYAIALSSQTIISLVVARAGTVDQDAPVLGIMRTMLSMMVTMFNIMFALLAVFYGYKLVIARGQQSELDTTKKGLIAMITGAVLINLSYSLVRAVGNIGF